MFEYELKNNLELWLDSKYLEWKILNENNIKYVLNNGSISIINDNNNHYMYTVETVENNIVKTKTIEKYLLGDVIEMIALDIDNIVDVIITKKEVKK